LKYLFIKSAINVKPKPVDPLLFNISPPFFHVVPAISRCAHLVFLGINLCKNWAAVIEPPYLPAPIFF